MFNSIELPSILLHVSGHRMATQTARTALDPPLRDLFTVRDQVVAALVTRTDQGVEGLAVNGMDMAIDPVDSAVDTTGRVMYLSLHLDPLLLSRISCIPWI